MTVCHTHTVRLTHLLHRLHLISSQYLNPTGQHPVLYQWKIMLCWYIHVLYTVGGISLNWTPLGQTKVSLIGRCP